MSSYPFRGASISSTSPQNPYAFNPYAYGERGSQSSASGGGHSNGYSSSAETLRKYFNFTNSPDIGRLIINDEVEDVDLEKQNPSTARMTTDQILNECLDIDRSLTALESRHEGFKSLISKILQDRATMADLDASSAAMMFGYRDLIFRMRKIKSVPECNSSRNASQVGRVDRRIKSSMHEFQRIEKDFRAQMKEQQARQYRVINPAATDMEVAQSVDSNTKVFQQALINADRSGRAQTALNAVRKRHQAIQQIEKTIIELAQLFQDLDTLVQEQDAKIEQAERDTEQTIEHIRQGNVHLGAAIVSVKKKKKNKCCCIGIIVGAVLAIIAILLIVFFVYRGLSKNVSNSGAK